MQRSEILILSYDLFRLNAPLLQQTTKIQLLVVDEGHRLKNTAGSQTMKALQDLPTKSRLCITATPIQNILSDVYTLGQFACPGVLGTLADFRSKYERPITAGSVKSASIQTKLMAARASKRLEQVASTFLLRRLQKDVLKTMLPPRQELLLFCRPSVLQCQMYRRLSREVEQKKSEALTTLTQLRKLCLHPSLLREGTTSRYAANNIQSSGKVVVLDSLLQHIRTYAPQDKVVVVSNYTSALSFVETNILQPRGFSFMRLDGTTPLAARQGLVDTFNASQSYFCFLLSSKAGGCGLNLVGANRLVMLDPDWKYVFCICRFPPYFRFTDILSLTCTLVHPNQSYDSPASDIQAMARVYRQGQTKPCWIYRLFTSGTVEEVICQRQLQKKNQQLEASSAKLKFSKDELQDCFTLKQKTNCDTKDKLGASWPIYTGIANLAWEHGPDTPLQAVSNDYSIPLTHVHLAVEQEETPKVMDAILDNASIPSDDDNIDDEQEFKLEFDDLPITQKKAPQALADVSIASSCSSEQEFEF
jgi:DNA repair and recombination RAD54-like protein